MTCINPAYANKIYFSRRFSRLLTVEGVEAIHTFVESNFIWKTYGYLPHLPIFREKAGNGAKDAEEEKGSGMEAGGQKVEEIEFNVIPDSKAKRGQAKGKGKAKRKETSGDGDEKVKKRKRGKGKEVEVRVAESVWMKGRMNQGSVSK